MQIGQAQSPAPASEPEASPSANAAALAGLGGLGGLGAIGAPTPKPEAPAEPAPQPTSEPVEQGASVGPNAGASSRSPFVGSSQSVDQGDYETANLLEGSRVLEGMPGLEIISERFAKSFRRTLATVLRQACEIQTISTEVITFSDFILQVPRPTGLFVFELPPLPGGCAVVVDGHLLLGLVDAFCGGPDLDLSEVDASAGRDLTQIELRLLDRLAAPMLNDITKAWNAVVPVEPRFSRTVIRPELSRLADEPESVIFVVFEAHIGKYRSPLALILPMSTIEPVRDRLLRVSHVPGHVRSSQPGRQLADHLPEVELELSVELGRAHINVRKLLALTEGDIIRLDTGADSSLVATLEGKRKFLGEPVAVGSTLTYKIIERVQK